ncbi:Uncharacterised protein [Mycobacterium tuberculosis]|nr:Uncharacterised protein [Mycobacterium tuberculosis]
MLRQADFFVEQLQELLHLVVIGEVGSQVHGGGTQEWVRTVFASSDEECQAYQEYKHS